MLSPFRYLIAVSLIIFFKSFFSHGILPYGNLSLFANPYYSSSVSELRPHRCTSANAEEIVRNSRDIAITKRFFDRNCQGLEMILRGGINAISGLHFRLNCWHNCCQVAANPRSRHSQLCSSARLYDAGFVYRYLDRICHRSHYFIILLLFRLAS